MTSALLGGRSFLIQARTLPGLVLNAPVARLVVVRPADVGLAGLFPNARLVLALASVAAVASLIGAVLRWRKFAG